MNIDEKFDLIVIGGGINGAGIAADASLRGLKVLLCEQNDLASATSSASTKLIHGGLRYLEYGEFRLVREALNEREILLKYAKHLVKPLNFLLPHEPKMRSFLAIRLGLFLYDHLAQHSTLPTSKILELQKHPAGHILNSKFRKAFQYTDCKTDDSRLVIANALQAKKYGATILTYTECLKATRKKDDWEVVLKNALTGKLFTKTCRVLVNATGPWAELFLKTRIGVKSQYGINLVKGSHIVVRKLYEEDTAFIFQHTDKRVIFIIPYLSHFHLIGTTDIIQNEPKQVEISKEEIDYLIFAVNSYLRTPILEEDIIHTWSGIRPLLKTNVKNPAAVTRDYEIEVQGSKDEPPLVSLFGGKLTTYRKVSENVIDQLYPFFNNLCASKTAHTFLPGSEYENGDNLLKEMQFKFPWLENPILKRYLQQYGTCTSDLLANCHHSRDLGHNFGNGLYQREVDYLVTSEWAVTAEDILWRRTKLGYVSSPECSTLLNKYLKK